jgi:hypothetical protein
MREAFTMFYVVLWVALLLPLKLLKFLSQKSRSNRDRSKKHSYNWRRLAAATNADAVIVTLQQEGADTNLRSGCTLTKKHDFHIEGVSEIAI